MINRESKTAFITGASSGIGAEFARRLAREGFDLVLHGRREDRLKELSIAISSQTGRRIEYILAELSDPAALREVEERVRTTPNLEMLVNNAGYSTMKRFRDEEIDEQENLIRVNVIVPVRLTHAALPAMVLRKSGAIINVSSVAAFMLSPNNTTYCATKLCLNSFTESLHIDVRKNGIRVQSLCPGFTISDFHRRMGLDTTGDFFRGFMSAEEVVETSLRDLQKGKVISIPGLKYKLAARVPGFLPRPLFYRVVDIYGSRKKAIRGLLNSIM